MLKQMSSMFTYIGWLFEKQKELQNHCVFKIIDIKNSSNNDVILYIQIANKSTVFQCSPSEIASNDVLLEKFSKQDIRTIIYHATKEITKPISKIISHRFSDNLKKILFKIKNRHSDSIEEKTLSEISKNTINDFNQEDAHRIGYLQAMQESIQEKEEIKMLSTKNKTIKNV